LESYYLQLMTTLAAFPQLAALIRNWIAVSGNPVLEQAQQDLEEAVMPWIEEVLTAGQAIGAVRTDLPPDLLIAVVASMGQAMDTWMLTPATRRRGSATVGPPSNRDDPPRSGTPNGSGASGWYPPGAQGCPMWRWVVG
jgi:hypothetical protein